MTRRMGKKKQSICAGAILCWLWLVTAVSQAYQDGASFNYFHADTPLLITSCGQTPDAFTVSAAAKRIGLAHRYDDLIVARDLIGFKTMIIAMGASQKGLGEAGLTVSTELSRVSALLAKAEREGIKVIAIHIGGEARRGGSSESFIDLFVQYAGCIIATSEGNKDGRFSVDAQKKGIPLYIMSQTKEIGALLGQIFRIN